MTDRWDEAAVAMEDACKHGTSEWEYYGPCSACVADGYRRAYAEGLERAAVIVADGPRFHYPCPLCCDHGDVFDCTAAAIRAEKLA